jgi:hypothetical protein
MAELGIGGNACAASASFTNVSCALPPDVVTISWLIQSVVEILDVEQARPAACVALTAPCASALLCYDTR